MGRIHKVLVNSQDVGVIHEIDKVGSGSKVRVQLRCMNAFGIFGFTATDSFERTLNPRNL